MDDSRFTHADVLVKGVQARASRVFNATHAGLVNILLGCGYF